MTIVRRKKLINDRDMDRIKRIALTSVINVIFILLFVIFVIAWTHFMPSIRQYCFANIGNDISDPAERFLRRGLTYFVILGYVPICAGTALSICAGHIRKKILVQNLVS